MPFTHDQFLDVFAKYNLALWPAACALWLASAMAAIWLLRSPARRRAIAAVLVVHWAWAGLAYHAGYFSAINPVAKVFAALFVVQALVFAWLGIARGRLHFSTPRRFDASTSSGSPETPLTAASSTVETRQGRRATAWHVAGFAFIVYGLLYPAIGLATGHVFPRMPTFGVPCPTTLFTAGFLLTIDPPFPRGVVVIPVLWAVVGGTGAFLLHVPADWALFLAAVALVAHALRRPARQPRVVSVAWPG